MRCPAGSVTDGGTWLERSSRISKADPATMAIRVQTMVRKYNVIFMGEIIIKFGHVKM